MVATMTVVTNEKTYHPVVLDAPRTASLTSIQRKLLRALRMELKCPDAASTTLRARIVDAVMEADRYQSAHHQPLLWSGCLNMLAAFPAWQQHVWGKLITDRYGKPAYQGGWRRPWFPDHRFVSSIPKPLLMLPAPKPLLMLPAPKAAAPESVAVAVPTPAPVVAPAPVAAAAHTETPQRRGELLRNVRSRQELNEKLRAFWKKYGSAPEAIEVWRDAPKEFQQYRFHGVRATVNPICQPHEVWIGGYA